MRLLSPNSTRQSDSPTFPFSSHSPELLIVGPRLSPLCRPCSTRLGASSDQGKEQREGRNLKGGIGRSRKPLAKTLFRRYTLSGCGSLASTCSEGESGDFLSEKIGVFTSWLVVIQEIAPCAFCGLLCYLI